MPTPEIKALRDIIRKQAPAMNHRGRKRIERACVEREKMYRQSQRPPILTVRMEASDAWQNQKRKIGRNPPPGIRLKRFLELKEAG